MKGLLGKLISILILAAAFGSHASDVRAGGFEFGIAQPSAQQQAQPNNTSNPFLQPGGNAAPATPQSQPGTAAWAYEALSVLGRLLLAVGLSAVLAFRPRQDVPLFKRSLFVSQTQILLSVVAAALMMIVGDNTARAFAIASLRT